MNLHDHFLETHPDLAAAFRASELAQNAIAVITAMMTHKNCAQEWDCYHADASSTFRALLCDFDHDYAIRDLIDDEGYLSIADAELMRALLDLIFDSINNSTFSSDSAREWITENALAESLCPMHFCDYAICFDDDAAECAQIRAIHPSHDT